MVPMGTESGLRDSDLQASVQTKIFKDSWRVTN